MYVIQRPTLKLYTRKLNYLLHWTKHDLWILDKAPRDSIPQLFTTANQPTGRPKIKCQKNGWGPKWQEISCQTRRDIIIETEQTSCRQSSWMSCINQLSMQCYNVAIFTLAIYMDASSLSLIKPIPSDDGVLIMC